MMLISEEEELVLFGQLHLQHDGPVVAVLGQLKSDLDISLGGCYSDERAAFFFNGLMEQAMRYNPVLKLFEEWDELPPGTTYVEASKHPIILI